MHDPGTLPLPIVDALELDATRRRILRPGEMMRDRAGRVRRLPRYFYEVDSWQTAVQLQLAEHFTLSEFLGVDVREAQPLRLFPRYVPCAVTLLAASLELVRQAVGTLIYIAANGGYRSPEHRLTDHASTHCWGIAANIYRVGDEYLDSQDRIERFGRLITQVLPSAWVRPYGHGKGEADDHLHVDLGYTVTTPRNASSEERTA
jgi:hypothetical protein